jgi:hypothetical protein
LYPLGKRLGEFVKDLLLFGIVQAASLLRN